MSKPILFLKSQIPTYTKKNGTVVKAHNRQHAAILDAMKGMTPIKDRGSPAAVEHFNKHSAHTDHHKFGDTKYQVHHDGDFDGPIFGVTQENADGSEEHYRSGGIHPLPKELKGGDEKKAGDKSADKVPDDHLDLMEDSLANDEGSSDEELHEHFTSQGVHPDHATEALKHRDEFLRTAIPPKGMLRDRMAKKK